VETITLADFKKLELVTAKILDVKDHPGADRLIVLSIDTGEESPRQIVAGIKLAYGKEELVGRTIIVIKNLEPAEIRGVKSQGMLLAAKNGGVLSMLGVDRELPCGSPIS